MGRMSLVGLLAGAAFLGAVIHDDPYYQQVKGIDTRIGTIDAQVERIETNKYKARLDFLFFGVATPELQGDGGVKALTDEKYALQTQRQQLKDKMIVGRYVM